MVKYEEAIKKPFTDIKKLLIGIILSMIPIVNSTIVVGYAIESSGLSKTKKSKKMPEWKNWSHLFVQGLAAIVIKIIYMIPALLVIITGIGLVIGDLVGIFLDTMIASDLVGETVVGSWCPTCQSMTPESREMIMEVIRGNWYLVLPTLLKVAPILLVGGLLALIAMFVSPIAVLNYVKKKRFAAAFELGTVFRKALTGKYIITWIVVMLLAAIIGAVLSFIPWIGGAIVLFIIGVLSYSLYGDVYREV